MEISRERPLLLGSASPRRRELLEGIGIPLDVAPADIDERREPGEGVAEFLSRIVETKLGSVVERARDRIASCVLVADTIVVLDGDVLLKPVDTADAKRLLGLLAGRRHTVYTRYAVATAAAPTAANARTVATEVTLRAASESEIERYAATGEGLDKAGAYAAQGVGTFLVQRIEGSFTNVVGLPVCEVIEDLKRLGVLGPFP
ncbi:MAG TPA: Maf family protein [Polyangiaceae bacterium]|jgi:septum formation protein